MPFNTGAQPSILLRFHFRLPRGNRMAIGEGEVDGTRCVELREKAWILFIKIV